MARPIMPQWRKRLHISAPLPLLFSVFPEYRRSPSKSYNATLVFRSSVALLLTLFLILTLLPEDVQNIPPPTASYRTLHMAKTAVQDFRTAENPSRPDPDLFQDDTENARLLVNVCKIPPVFVSRLASKGRRRLLRRLTKESNGILLYDSMPKVIIADLQNGLGNRLRALASALEFAYHTRRVLIVLWAPDAHINATMQDLFGEDVLRNLIIIREPVSWPIQPNDIHASLGNGRVTRIEHDHPAQKSFKFFSYMAKDKKFSGDARKRIQRVTSFHLYIKTAYVLNSVWNRRKLLNAFIQALTPAPAVLKLVDQIERRVGGSPAMRTMIGVHIRSRPIVQDNAAIDHECEYSVSGAAVTDKWRSMSSPIHFIPEMKRMRRQWPRIIASSYGTEPVRSAAKHQAYLQSAYNNSEMSSIVPVDVSRPPRFFVSADSIETINMLRAKFSRYELVTLPRDCDDRGPQCILYAFADIILLSRTGALLASGWSSFSEAAARMRVRTYGLDPSRKDGYVIRTSGIDFGGPSSWEKFRRHVSRTLRNKGNLRTTDSKGRVRTQEERRKLCYERQMEDTPVPVPG